jgi:hypothetical protein
VFNVHIERLREFHEKYLVGGTRTRVPDNDFQATVLPVVPVLVASRNENLYSEYSIVSSWGTLVYSVLDATLLM